MCNVWQGRFPSVNSADDGYAFTCPVRVFPPNAYGLHSVTGNVSEWCADWLTTDHEARSSNAERHGGKVMKGGSFLCHASYCNRATELLAKHKIALTAQLPTSVFVAPLIF